MIFLKSRILRYFVLLNFGWGDGWGGMGWGKGGEPPIVIHSVMGSGFKRINVVGRGIIADLQLMVTCTCFFHADC